MEEPKRCCICGKPGTRVFRLEEFKWLVMLNGVKQEVSLPEALAKNVKTRDAAENLMDVVIAFCGNACKRQGLAAVKKIATPVYPGGYIKFISSFLERLRQKFNAIAAEKNDPKRRELRKKYNAEKAIRVAATQATEEPAFALYHEALAAQREDETCEKVKEAVTVANEALKMATNLTGEAREAESDAGRAMGEYLKTLK